MLQLKTNKTKMNYPDTHDSVYLKYDNDPYNVECGAVLICLQMFWRKRRHDGKLGKIVNKSKFL